MLDEILERGVGLIRDLGLAYRILDICTGDMGQSHHRSFDIEVYSPGVDQWLEVSSVSWFSDYQARRANIRYRPRPPATGDGKAHAEMVHTLNGSALAVPRVWAALVETHRQPDGSVRLPEVLWPYLRGATTIGPRDGLSGWPPRGWSRRRSSRRRVRWGAVAGRGRARLRARAVGGAGRHR